MLLGIVSDSHDHLRHLEAALARFTREAVQAVIHPGDFVAPFAARTLAAGWQGPRAVVYGNNDGERAGLKSVLPDVVDGPILLEWGGRRLSVDHYPPDAVHRPIPDVDLCIFGHTHQMLWKEVRGTWWLNPGECCGWVTGTASVCLLDLTTLKADFVTL